MLAEIKLITKNSQKPALLCRSIYNAWRNNERIKVNSHLSPGFFLWRKLNASPNIECLLYRATSTTKLKRKQSSRHIIPCVVNVSDAAVKHYPS
ncbi:hypothetical protein EUGRSUZ_D00976 [Eucalyptus grandis]|uniref:Uncharacterized protein n=2 Tax=Eucalyptus grandis TaxID=71139 RepID=A0ACC3L4X8_EUCGR|nr:hypothetical protein EUGRSUZ_D00976 [Eucalyptus grandis]